MTFWTLCFIFVYQATAIMCILLHKAELCHSKGRFFQCRITLCFFLQSWAFTWLQGAPPLWGHRKLKQSLISGFTLTHSFNLCVFLSAYTPTHWKQFNIALLIDQRKSWCSVEVNGCHRGMIDLNSSMVTPETSQPPLIVMDARMWPITFLSVTGGLTAGWKH